MLQETESSSESVRSLLWLIVFVSANIFFIYYIFEDQKLYRRQVCTLCGSNVKVTVVLLCHWHVLNFSDVKDVQLIVNQYLIF